jgi:hypothetical protein
VTGPGARSGRRLVLATALVVVGASCASDADRSQPTGPTVTALEALAPDDAGVEVALDATGVEPRASLLVIPPEGWRARAVVSVVAPADGPAPALTMTAEVLVGLVAVEPDGSHRLRLELGEIRPRSPDARPGVVTDLWLLHQPATGTVLEVLRSPDGALIERRLTLPGASLPSAVEALARQLVEAPVMLAGPFPTAEIGAGAGWSWTTLDPDGTAGRYRFRLVRLDASGFEIDAVYALEDGEGLRRAGGDVVLQGVVGDLLPRRQHWSVTTAGAGPRPTEVELTVELEPG